LSLGSNIDAANNIRAAVKALRLRFDSLQLSPVYESEALGFEGDNFLNLVAATDTDAALAEIADYLKSLEDALGRDRSQPKFSGRSMDIDILFHGRESGAAQGLCLPRAEITEHAYVLRPLADLLPESVHGPSGLSYASLWRRFDDPGQRLWQVAFDWSGDGPH